MTARPVKTQSAVGALFSIVGRDFHELLSNPSACIGGAIGTVVVAVILYFGVGVMGQDATAGDADDTEELEMEFLPGTIAKLGQKLEEKDIPEKIVTRDTRAPDQGEQEAVTKDENQAPQVERDKKSDEPKTESKLPSDDKDKKLPTSKTPTDKNTPYDDLPTVDTPIGDPFGSPDGWSDMTRGGDPWATAVMGVLNKGIEANAYAAKSAVSGAFQFRITICRDGTISEIQKKGTSGDPQIDYSVEQNLRRIKLPKPPPDIAKQLGDKCKRIPYTFRWNPKGGVK